MVTEERNHPDPERRRYPRRNFSLPFHYKSIQGGRISQPGEGKSQDLGAGGIGALFMEPLESGQKLMLTIFLPKEMFRGSSTSQTATDDKALPVSIFARVVWCTPTPDNRYRAGIQFLELDRYSCERMKNFLEAIQLDRADCPLYF